MWLFIGRYAHFGPIICFLAVAASAGGLTFLIGAVRLIRKSDLAAALVTATVAVYLGYSAGFSEPVFVGNGGLNRGAVLFAALLGTILGGCGCVVARRLRLTRMMLLMTAAGILLGDVAGWIQRSAAPSKYDHPIGSRQSIPERSPVDV